jgi:hypothetical protein
MSYTILPEPDTSTLPEDYVKKTYILKTVVDEWGGKFHIKLDDGCYVCVHEAHHTGKVEVVDAIYICPAFFAALRDLPCPSEMRKQILRERGLEPFTEEAKRRLAGAQVGSGAFSQAPDVSQPTGRCTE